MQNSWASPSYAVPPTHTPHLSAPSQQIVSRADELSRSLHSSLETLREILDVPLSSSQPFQPLPPNETTSSFLSTGVSPSVLESMFTHPYIAFIGTTYDPPQRKFTSVEPEAYLKPEFAKALPPSKKVVELQKKQQDLLAALQRCHRMTDKYLKDKREAPWVVRQLQRITTDLNMDFDASQAIVFGTKGANTGFCFMAEITLDKPPSLVQSAAATYLIGNPEDVPGPSVEASAELQQLIMDGDLEQLHLKLCRIRAFENLLMRHPEASLHLSLSHVETAFTQLANSIPQVSHIRLLEGPSLKYFQLPLADSKPFHLTFLGPVEIIGEGGQLTFPYQFELQPPVCMDVATLSRLATEVMGLSPSLQPPVEGSGHLASLHLLLSVCDKEGIFRIPQQLPSRSHPIVHTMPDGFQQIWTAAGPAISQRGALVSRLTLYSLDHLGSLLQTLRQQVTFNHLYQSTFNSFTPPPEDSKNLPFEIYAEPPVVLHVVTQTFALVISAADARVTVEAVGTNKLPCSSTYATRLLQTCFSIPLTVRFICQKVQDSD